MKINRDIGEMKTSVVSDQRAQGLL